MPIEWKPAWAAPESFDGYDGKRIVARVIRYGVSGSFPHFEPRGFIWQGFLSGYDVPEVEGRHATPDLAKAATEAAYDARVKMQFAIDRRARFGPRYG